MLNIVLISLYGVENNGIRSISSVLQRERFNTSLIFFKRWLNNDIQLPSEEEKNVLLSHLKELKTDVVGISFTSPFLRIAQDLTQRIKGELRIKVVWGGMHATAEPEKCLEYCDIVCRGEGEYAMLDIAKAINENRPIEGIKNISYMKEGEAICEDMRPLIQDLDSLPQQDYESENKFFIDKKLYKIDSLKHARELRIFASRGCPFNCSYCYNSILRRLYKNQRYHRIKSVEGVISEIDYALSKFKNIRKIKFDDDTFIFPKDWIDEFCKQYKDRINLPFEILFNAECLDEEVLKALKAAGLKRVQVGIQTGSKTESEDIYNRSLKVDKIRQFACVAKALHLDVVYDLILDNPLSSFEDKKTLINFLLTLPRPFDIFLYSLTVFPGTALSTLLLSRGIISPKDIEGEANKSFYQFRLSFSYPRKKEELFIACMLSLTSKSFIPKSFISLLMRSYFLRNHPLPLKWFAEICNNLKLISIAMGMFKKGTLNISKLKEYGLPRRFLIQ